MLIDVVTNNRTAITNAATNNTIANAAGAAAAGDIVDCIITFLSFNDAAVKLRQVNKYYYKQVGLHYKQGLNSIKSFDSENGHWNLLSQIQVFDEPIDENSLNYGDDDVSEYETLNGTRRMTTRIIPPKIPREEFQSIFRNIDRIDLSSRKRKLDGYYKEEKYDKKWCYRITDLALIDLYFISNHIIHLDISNCQSLHSFSISRYLDLFLKNGLQEFIAQNISPFKEDEKLSSSNETNKLIKLDVSNNPWLLSQHIDNLVSLSPNLKYLNA
jgi:hypothetical protein